MDASKNPYVAVDDDRLYGRLVTATWDLDDSWMDEGLCRRYPAARDETGWTWWMADTIDNGGSARRPASEQQRAEKAAMALMICHNCPVQYECTNYAVRGEVSAGVWGVRSSNLKWLQTRGRAIGVDVLDGRDSGEPVEVWVNNLRQSLILA